MLPILFSETIDFTGWSCYPHISPALNLEVFETNLNEGKQLENPISSILPRIWGEGEVMDL